MIFQKLLNGLTAQKHEDRRTELYRNLMRHEAKIGGKLFGPVPPGVKREFFSLDKYTWVWHEDWVDQNGQAQTRIIRYDFRPDGVLKSQNGQYQPITREEARHLRDAIRLYGEKIDQELYSRIRASRSK
jgi:hypothetical protein